ncbi:hypothetical protein SAMN05444166_1019 [Singulisphaera sp. GP187]|uniref:hypothetical protein n=1 Tax=Singulisphaera sp. GP187 TaxID=1882752 RepID=UPI000929833E|nr:hypothetical protein [Singulisphaera sp. GP187]SIN81131.1 hypothetical protein SAMN05444166_1019 [Singulisphaera sp. GP187]
MTDPNDALGERLLGLDSPDPAIQQRHEAELHSQWETQLSGSRLVPFVAVGVAGLIACLVCGSLAFTEPATTPVAVRRLLALFACFGLSWTLLATWILTRGRGSFISQRTLAARMAFGFTLTTVMALSLVSLSLGREAAGMPILATGLALLILAAVLLTDVRIERAELTIREQILRVESRLIERIEASQRPAGKKEP